jgi:RNA recognition motif-containing protein
MPSGQRVFIGNIPSDCRERDLEKFFKGYGKLIFFYLKKLPPYTLAGFDLTTHKLPSGD